jgi:serine/threonine protein kinase
MAQQKAVEMPVEDLDDLVDELEPGTKLLKGQYTITRYLNSGGFGITYLAKDSLDRNVVIKECFPAAFSRRSKTVVAARSRAHTAELRSVVQLFVKEARSLSKIVHPNIVAVHQVFEDNGTAYMAIDYVDGLDLQQIIDGQGTLPTADEIVVITEKLLHAIGFIHANDMLHRDISPDNVLISKAGEPVLIDFGAAREQASQAGRAMSALRVVKDGYSPQEFYIAGSEQGPWSDLYALGATLFHLITGEAPVNGQARLAALAEDRTDPYLKLDGRFGGYPDGFLAAIDKALCTLPKQRVQSAQEWLAMFSDGQSVTAAAGKVVPSSEPLDASLQDLIRTERAEAGTTPQPHGKAAGFGVPPQFVRQASQPRPTSAAVVPAAPTGGGVAKVQVFAGIAATLAVIGAGFLIMGGGETPAQPETAAVDEPAAPAAAEPVAVAAADPAPAAPVAADPALAAATPAPVAADPALAATTPAPVAADPAPVTADPAPAAPAPAEEAAPAAPEPTAVAAVEAETTVVPETAAVAEVEEPAAEVAVADPVSAPSRLAAPVGTLRANQVAFAAWDIELPFIEGSRIVENQRVAIVQSVVPGTDLSLAGTWIEPGVRVLSVNGVDVQQAGSVATAVLNAMTVDPDGSARVVVEYSTPTTARESGLLTVTANRLVSLGNGMNFTIRTVDGQWQTVVTGVTVPSATQLRQGDVLYRDKATGLALDGPQSLETIMAALVEQGAGVTEFSVLRDNRITEAGMQLAAD